MEQLPRPCVNRAKTIVEVINMRRFFSLLLVPLLLLGMVSPALAANYRDMAEAYLNQKYGGNDATIEMHQDGIMELEFTGQSFWYVEYTVVPAGAPATGATGEKPVPDIGQTEPPLALPEARDLPLATIEPAVMPRLDSYHHNYVYGVLYIHVESGKILEMDEMEPYFTEEAALAEQEWARLRQEAGKLDVSLYRKLLTLAATESVKVTIHPALTITAEVEAQFAILQDQYPRVFAEMNIELGQFLDGTWGAAGEGKVMPAMDCVVGYATTVTPAVSVDPPVRTPLGDDPVPPVPPEKSDSQYNEQYWQEYNAFWAGMEQLRLMTMADSLREISAALEDMGVAYTGTDYYISAELTATQVRAIAEHQAVGVVYEELGYAHAMDANMALRGRVETDQLAVAPAMNAEAAPEPAAVNSRVPLIVGGLAVGLAAVVVSKRRQA
jgi:hypothetical protein